MAKRKNGKDNTMRNLLIGFGSVFLILIGAWIGSDMATVKYNDFEQITEYEEVDKQEEDLYAVYYYYDECGACKSIKAETLDFASGNNYDIKFYRLHAYQTSGNKDYITILNGGTQMNSTPTLLLFKDGVLIDYLVGADDIKLFYNQVENGSYDLD